MNKHYHLICRRQGFTLIELLVVMVIIAVLAAGVALTINFRGSSAQQINDVGEKLFAQMNYALDEALVSNTVIGMDFQQDKDNPEVSKGYLWKRHEGFDEIGLPKFADMAQPLAGRHELPEGLAWGDREIDGADDLDKLLLGDDEEQEIPELLFYPSGEITEFSVTITLSEEALADDPEAIDEYYKIVLDERGELTRYRVGEEQQ